MLAVAIPLLQLPFPQPRPCPLMETSAFQESAISTARAGARILATQSYRLTTLTIRQHLLVGVQAGRKELHSAHGQVVAKPGQALLVAQNTQWDVINDPAGDLRYEAIVLSFDDALVRENLPCALEAGAQAVHANQLITLDEELLGAMQRTLPAQSGQPGSARIQHHRLLEVLILLAERGLYFAPASEMDWSERIRQLVWQQPGAEWNVPVLAERFHLSESSLRRRLDGYGTSVAAVVREARLERALELLQTTATPVGEVARLCGWDSHSRFSAVFQERWGVSPSVVRARLKESAQELTETE